MAIKLSDEYPGRVDAPSSDYPDGKPRNIVTPGDGTGTPFDYKWLTDMAAFFQWLLKTTGSTPNGNLDTANNSQYGLALMSLFSYHAFSDVSADTTLKTLFYMGEYPYQKWTGRQWSVNVTSALTPGGESATGILTCTDATANGGIGTYTLTSVVKSSGIDTFALSELKAGSVDIKLTGGTATQTVTATIR